MTGYPPLAPPDRTSSHSPLYAPLAHPTPPHLAHSRYSSADLYALQPESSGGEPQSQTASTGLLPQQNSPFRDRDEDDSDSSDDGEGGGGGGFGTYRDFNQENRNHRQSRNMPPLNSRMSTSGTMSTLQNPSGGGGSTYQLKEHMSSTAKFEGGGAYETVAMPKISGDWSRGEGLNEKNDKKFAKSRKKRREMKGFVGRVYENSKRKWKIVLPATLLFLLGCALFHSTLSMVENFTDRVTANVDRLILILYFCIPRTPTITFRHQKVPSTVFTSTDENPFITSTDPVSYSFRGNLIFARTFLLSPFFPSLSLSLEFADSKSSHFGCTYSRRIIFLRTG